MSLILCKECGNQISDQAKSCPHCGCPVQPQQPHIPNQPQQVRINNNNQPRKGESVLGIVGLCISCIFCAPIFPIAGFILCVIALMNKTKNSACGKVGLVLSIIFFIISTSIWGSLDSENEENSNIYQSEESVLENNPENTKTIEIKETKEEFIAKCEEIPYKTLARSPKEYIGKYIALDVKITQIMQGGILDKNEYYRVYSNDEYGFWMGDEYFMYDKRIDNNMKLLQDDVIRVYGKFVGTETIVRALTNTKEDIPAFEAVYVELIEE